MWARLNLWGKLKFQFRDETFHQKVNEQLTSGLQTSVAFNSTAIPYLSNAHHVYCLFYEGSLGGSRVVCFHFKKQSMRKSVAALSTYVRLHRGNKFLSHKNLQSKFNVSSFAIDSKLRTMQAIKFQFHPRVCKYWASFCFAQRTLKFSIPISIYISYNVKSEMRFHTRTHHQDDFPDDSKGHYLPCDFRPPFGEPGHVYRNERSVSAKTNEI